jgi:hypothetical protein
MDALRKLFWCAALRALPLAAQDTPPTPPPASNGAVAAVAKPAMSEAGKKALAGARDAAQKLRGLRGPERAPALEAAASAYDKVVADFGGEPAVAAFAAITAADLWRQQGSLPLAEKAYLRAAELDGIEPEEEVMHDRVADDRHLDDVGALHPRLAGHRADELVEGLAHGRGQLALAARVHHHVRDPAHQVLAEPDLRVHEA